MYLPWTIPFSTLVDPMTPKIIIEHYLKILTLFSFEVERCNPGYLNLCPSFFTLLSDGITRICHYSQMTVNFLWSIISVFLYIYTMYFASWILRIFYLIFANLYMDTWDSHTNVSINTILRVDHSICIINDSFVETNFLWSHLFLINYFF